jgi:hypothetical protein
VAAGDLKALCGRLSGRDIDTVVATLLETLVSERIDDLESRLDRPPDVATTAKGEGGGQRQSP